MGKRSRFTLMPLITLAALSAMVTVPALSGVHLYAATPQHYAVVVVRPGDTLWSIASSRIGNSGDIQETIDRISEINRLDGAALIPGQKLHVPRF